MLNICYLVVLFIKIREGRIPQYVSILSRRVVEQLIKLSTKDKVYPIQGNNAHGEDMLGIAPTYTYIPRRQWHKLPKNCIQINFASKISRIISMSFLKFSGWPIGISIWYYALLWKKYFQMLVIIQPRRSANSPDQNKKLPLFRLII